LYLVFQTTSVQEYNDIISHMEKDARINPYKKRTYEELLRESLLHYKSLSQDNKWNHTKDTGAAFNADDGRNRNNGSSSFPSTSPYCAPTTADRIKSDPECFERIIKDKTMKYCGKCTRFKGSNKKGRWNTSHFTHEHTGGRSANTTGGTSLGEGPGAHVAEDTTPTEATRVSFDQGLLDAQADN
jgi:hypothetical protein